MYWLFVFFAGMLSSEDFGPFLVEIRSHSVDPEARTDLLLLMSQFEPSYARYVGEGFLSTSNRLTPLYRDAKDPDRRVMGHADFFMQNNTRCRVLFASIPSDECLEDFWEAEQSVRPNSEFHGELGQRRLKTPGGTVVKGDLVLESTFADICYCYDAKTLLVGGNQVFELSPSQIDLNSEFAKTTDWGSIFFPRRIPQSVRQRWILETVVKAGVASQVRDMEEANDSSHGSRSALWAVREYVIKAFASDTRDFRVSIQMPRLTKPYQVKLAWRAEPESQLSEVFASLKLRSSVRLQNGDPPLGEGAINIAVEPDLRIAAEQLIMSWKLLKNDLAMRTAGDYGLLEAILKKGKIQWAGSISKDEQSPAELRFLARSALTELERPLRKLNLNSAFSEFSTGTNQELFKPLSITLDGDTLVVVPADSYKKASPVERHTGFGVLADFNIDAHRFLCWIASQGDLVKIEKRLNEAFQSNWVPSGWRGCRLDLNQLKTLPSSDAAGKQAWGVSARCYIDTAGQSLIFESTVGQHLFAWSRANRLFRKEPSLNQQMRELRPAIQLEPRVNR